MSCVQQQELLVRALLVSVPGEFRKKPMSYPGEAAMDLSWGGSFERTPLIAELMQELGPEMESQTPEEVTGRRLDMHSDLPGDEPAGLVAGINGQLQMTVGKYSKGSQLTTFAWVYEQDKGYAAWVRKHIKTTRGTGTANKPSQCMLRLRLYVALRDQRKGQRLQHEQQMIEVTARSSASLVLPLRAKGKAAPKSAATMNSMEPEEPAEQAEEKKQRLQMQMEMLRQEMEAIEASSDAGVF